MLIKDGVELMSGQWLVVSSWVEGRVAGFGLLVAGCWFWVFFGAEENREE
ncbi:hypothetical protein [Carboxylicivirga mesophila]|nr:hypothetical protein [Carboxylicivirga mesophila]